jgi:hypothetical protein
MRMGQASQAQLHRSERALAPIGFCAGRVRELALVSMLRPALLGRGGFSSIVLSAIYALRVLPMWKISDGNLSPDHFNHSSRAFPGVHPVTPDVAVLLSEKIARSAGRLHQGKYLRDLGFHAAVTSGLCERRSCP